MAQDRPIMWQSASRPVDLCKRSWALGLANHRFSPLSVVEIEHQVLLASPEDWATRFRKSHRVLRGCLGQVEVINEMYRAVNASLDPTRVADSLVARVAAWLPAASWSVVGPGSPDTGVLMAARGLAPDAERAARAVGAWVLDHSREYVSVSARNDLSVVDAPDVAVFAIPLICRGRTVAALVGINREPSRTPPRLSATTLATLGGVLEPAALALDNAFRVRRAEELSVTDDLTQLYNSRYLSRELHREAKRSTRTGQPLSLLFVDLDEFKGINDRHGHLYGSRALVEAASLIRDCSRKTDVVARFGGDEFAILLSDTGNEGALAVAARIHERVRRHVFLRAQGIKIRLTASLGIATMPDSAETVEELLQAADDAMYWVKTHGKDGIRLSGSNVREDRSA